MKCPWNEVSLTWSVLNIKFPWYDMIRKVLNMKCPWDEVYLIWSTLDMKYPWNEVSMIWSVLEVRCPWYDASLMWSVLDMMRPWCEVSSIWSVIDMKCPWYEVSMIGSVLDMKCPWNEASINNLSLTWGVLDIKCLWYEATPPKKKVRTAILPVISRRPTHFCGSPLPLVVVRGIPSTSVGKKIRQSTHLNPLKISSLIPHAEEEIASAAIAGVSFPSLPDFLLLLSCLWWKIALPSLFFQKKLHYNCCNCFLPQLIFTRTCFHSTVALPLATTVRLSVTT